MTPRKLKDYLYTGIQFLLFIAYLFHIQFVNLEFPLWISYGGLIFAAGGIIIAVLALYQIRYSLSPFPSPLPEAKLITHGIFRYIRHPIYTGILLAGIGYALYTTSFYRIGVTVLLYMLFYFKSRYEEKLLLEKFPEYAQYKQSTGRFWPRNQIN